MRRKGQMANGSVGFSTLSVVPYPSVHHLVEVAVLVDAVDEAEVRIVGAQIPQTLFELRYAHLRIRGPAVFFQIGSLPRYGPAATPFDGLLPLAL